MKKYLILLVLSLSVQIVTGQENESPIDFFSGNWIRKVNSVTPKQEAEPWRGQTTYVEFKRILNGRGLKQVSYQGLDEVETYFFYDEPTKKMYSTGIDANGYVWQSEMVLTGNKFEITGKAINDDTVKETIQLIIVDQTEMKFVYTMFKDNNKVLTAEGVFLKIPKH